MSVEVCISKEIYNSLLHKAQLFDRIVEEEGLTTEELDRLEKAKKTKALSEQEFFDKYKELE